MSIRNLRLESNQKERFLQDVRAAEDCLYMILMCERIIRDILRCSSLFQS
jgi:hypothetical protein